MSDGFLATLILLAAIGCGVVGGVFFAFSAFVMRALARLPSAQGIAAMQAINAAAPAPLFMAVLFGTALACITLVVASLVMWEGSRAIFLFTGSALYLVGPVLLTIVYHVPRNDALAKVDPHGAGAERHWNRYLSGWTAWNHVRTAASVAAAAMLTIALDV
jgi:uncharacterized membrane protein